MVGLLPLCATTVIEEWQRERVPRVVGTIRERFKRMPELLRSIHAIGPEHYGMDNRSIFALVNQERLRRIPSRMLDENEFMAVAVTALTLPGARLIHGGQMEGRRVRLPVFLSRRPEEPEERELSEFYERLLEVLRNRNFADGRWQLCERTGWPDNQSHMNLVAWCWQNGEFFCLIVVNLSGVSSQGMIKVPLQNLRERTLRLKDTFTSAVYERSGNEMCDSGMCVDLPAWGFHILLDNPK